MINWAFSAKSPLSFAIMMNEATSFNRSGKMPPLIINVQDVKEEGLSLNFVIDDVIPPAEIERRDFAVSGRVTFNAVAYKAGRDIFIRGEMSTTLTLRCARCLEEFRYPLQVEVKTNYLYGKEETPGEEETTEEMMDEDTCFYRGDTINMADEIWSQIHLSLPMKPLCREGCRGLCQLCGTNLNRRSCDCGVGEADPRFAILKGLKLK